jgi:RsfA family transcription factor
MAKIRWTKQEDEIIVNALEVYMNADKPFSEAYREITKFLTNRTESAIAQRWKSALKKLHPTIKDLSKKYPTEINLWTTDEDILVVDKILDKISGGGKIEDVYPEIHELLPDRTEASIRFRWWNTLRKQFNEEYQEAHAKRKVVLDDKRKQPKNEQPSFKFVEQSIAEPEVDINTETVNNTFEEIEREKDIIIGRLALSDKEEQAPVSKKLIIEEPEEVKVDPVDIQETQHLTNFLDNITGMIEERAALREENISLRQQNQRLNSRLKEKEDEYEKLEAKYRDVIIMISRVQELMGEQSATTESLDELHSLKLKMERNGNLVRVQ